MSYASIKNAPLVVNAQGALPIDLILKEGRVHPEITVPESNVQLVKDQVLENDDFLVKLNEHFVITKD